MGLFKNIKMKFTESISERYDRIMDTNCDEVSLCDFYFVLDFDIIERVRKEKEQNTISEIEELERFMNNRTRYSELISNREALKTEIELLQKRLELHKL